MNDKSEFEFDVMSPMGKGVAHVSGTFDQDSDDWNIDSLVFTVDSKQKKQEIKLV